MFTGKKVIYSISLLCVIMSIQYSQRNSYNLTHAAQYDLYFVPEPRYVKLLTSGFTAVAADIYWIKTVLYFGKRTNNTDFPMITKQLLGEQYTEEYQKWEADAKVRYTYMADMINMVVELDPYFLDPYFFGGLMLSMKYGNSDKSIALLQKGIPYFSDKWQFNYLLGFNYYFYKGNTLDAAKHFIRAAEFPDCPDMIKRFGVAVLKDLSRRGIAIEFIQGQIEQTKNPELRTELKAILKELQQSYQDSVRIKK
jgi:tetratricopeptide (TPR) repeat protein